MAAEEHLFVYILTFYCSNMCTDSSHRRLIQCPECDSAPPPYTHIWSPMILFLSFLLPSPSCYPNLFPILPSINSSFPPSFPALCLSTSFPHSSLFLTFFVHSSHASFSLKLLNPTRLSQSLCSPQPISQSSVGGK